MNKILIFLFIWLFSLPTHAMSSDIFADGIARVTLKNHYPCVYLSNGKKISHIQFSGQKSPKGFSPTIPDGSSREQCVFFDGGTNTLQYNIRTDIYLNDKGVGITEDTHIASFCVLKDHDSIRLVATEQDHCSTQTWRPQKYYSGLFGKIEQFIDWLFNLNGYTKETF